MARRLGQRFRMRSTTGGPLRGVTSDTAVLIRRYDRPGPRYTSYPTAVEFSDRFDERVYRRHLNEAAALAGEPSHALPPSQSSRKR